MILWYFDTVNFVCFRNDKRLHAVFGFLNISHGRFAHGF